MLEITKKQGMRGHIHAAQHHPVRDPIWVSESLHLYGHSSEPKANWLRQRTAPRTHNSHTVNDNVILHNSDIPIVLPYW